MSAIIEFKLPDKLTIERVSRLHEELEPLSSQKDADQIHLDAEAVLKTDAAGMQLLAVFTHDALAHNIKTCLLRPSDDFCHASKILGLNGVLGIS